jgi:hypothetical protein
VVIGEFGRMMVVLTFTYLVVLSGIRERMALNVQMVIYILKTVFLLMQEQKPFNIQVEISTQIMS